MTRQALVKTLTPNSVLLRQIRAWEQAQENYELEAAKYESTLMVWPVQPLLIDHDQKIDNNDRLAQPRGIEAKSHIDWPSGGLSRGHQTCASKLAQANEGVGPSLLFSMPSPFYWPCSCIGSLMQKPQSQPPPSSGFPVGMQSVSSMVSHMAYNSCPEGCT